MTAPPTCNLYRIGHVQFARLHYRRQGLTYCVRVWQLRLMMSMTRGTLASSVPTRIVALPSRRKPPVVLILVRRSPRRARPQSIDPRHRYGRY